MTRGTSTRPLRVVVAGGGVAGLEVLVALRGLAGDRVEPTLVDTASEFHLHALDSGEAFGLSRARRYPLPALAARLSTALVPSAVARVAGDERVALLRDGRALSYDALVLALGATPRPAFEHGTVFDPVAEGATLRRLRGELDADPGRRVAVVVPPGVGWTLPAYELALMLAGTRGTHVTLVTAEEQALEALGTAATDMIRGELADDGVTLVTGASARVERGRVLIHGREPVDADRIVHLPVPAGPGLEGVPCDEHGFMPVDDLGRVTGLPDVFAVGDCTTATLKQGGLAAQQSEGVAVLLARRAGAPVAEAPGPPVLRAILRTRRGPRYIVADPSGASPATISHDALWWPPTKVASTWLMPWLAARGDPAGMTVGARPR